MRTFRMLLAALAVGVLSLIGISSPASAAESEEACLAKAAAEHNITAETAEHLTEEQETAISDCFESPNPLIPELNELIWGAVGFFIVMGFLWWKGVPAIKKTMAERTARIEGDLAAAEAQKAETGQVLADYKAQLADARNESARIIEEARQTADEMKQQLAVKAQADIAEMRQTAATDIESAKAQAIADLRSEVTALAIGAAEQVVQRNLDQETNVALVEAYINQVGTKS